MVYINEERINNLLADAQEPGEEEVERILKKSRSLQRLTLEEAAILLSVQDARLIKKLFSAASSVKEAIYGRRVVLFAPLYISNFCSNNCLYCAFKSDNSSLQRRALGVAEIKEQVRWLLSRGHKRILMVAGESSVEGKSSIEYYTESIDAIYAASFQNHRIKRVNVNCAPLSVEEFVRLKKTGIGTYQLFQETYHEATYRRVHPRGPKADANNRIDAINRAFSAGIDDIGIGVLYGLYDYKFETLALLSHIEHMESSFGVGPHTISVPRVEPAAGSAFSLHPPHPLGDEDFKKVVAVLRLSVPYTGIILSTRETPEMRDELLSLGVSQISAESRTSPGGYSSQDNNADNATQFFVGDQRTLDEIIASLIEEGYIPSFCAACYRKQRTGEVFMNLAKPGTIKGKCSFNALVTLQEYLKDFASDKVRLSGSRMIDSLRRQLKSDEQKLLAQMFRHVESGIRDEFV